VVFRIERKRDARRNLVDSNLALQTKKELKLRRMQRVQVLSRRMWPLVAEAKSRPPITAQLPALCSPTKKSIHKHPEFSSGKLLC
jgi:hypothetical protein